MINLELTIDNGGFGSGCWGVAGVGGMVVDGMMDNGCWRGIIWSLQEILEIFVAGSGVEKEDFLMVADEFVSCEFA